MSKFKIGDLVKKEIGNGFIIVDVLDVQVDRYFVSDESMEEPFHGRVVAAGGGCECYVGDLDFFNATGFTLHRPVIRPNASPHHDLMVEFFSTPGMLVEEYDTWSNEWVITDNPYFARDSTKFRRIPVVENPNAELAILWAGDITIPMQYRSREESPGEWMDIEEPSFNACYEYRIKPARVASPGEYYRVLGGDGDYVVVVTAARAMGGLETLVVYGGSVCPVGEDVYFASLSDDMVLLDNPFASAGEK